MAKFNDDGSLVVDIEFTSDKATKQAEQAQKKIQAELDKTAKQAQAEAEKTAKKQEQEAEKAEKARIKAEEAVAKANEKEQAKIQAEAEKTAKIQKQQAEKAAKDIEDAYKDINTGINTGLNNVSTGILTGVTATTVALGALQVEMQEYNKDIAVLENNAKIAGVALDDVGEHMKDLNAITGETDSNVEALSNLFESGLKGDALEQAVDGLSGAVLKFPDTIKIESLAESLNETIKKGQATTTFIQLIEQTGGVVEEFDAQMAKATTEVERQNVALDYLAKAGLADVNEQYRANNEELIANADAQFELNEQLAELGEKITPIMTEVVELFADLTGTVIENKDEILLLTGALTGGAVALKAYLVVSQLSAKLQALKLATNSATTAQLALNVAQSANPVGLVVTAIGTLIGVMGVLALTTEDTTSEVKELTDAYEKNMDAIDDNYESQVAVTNQADTLRDRILELDTQLQDNTLSTEEFNSKQAEMEALAKQLTEIIPEVERALYNETGAIQIQRLEVDELTNSFINLAIAQAQSEVYGEKITEALRTQVDAEEKLVELQNQYNAELAKAKPNQSLEWLGLGIENIDFSLGLDDTIQDTALMDKLSRDIYETEKLIKEAQSDVTQYAEAQSQSLLNLTEVQTQNTVDTADMTLQELEALYEKEYGNTAKVVEDVNEVIEDSYVQSTATATEAVKTQAEIQQEAMQERYDALKEEVEYQISLEQLTLEQQEEIWKDASEEFANYSDIRKEIDVNLFNVQKEINAERLAEEELLAEEQLKTREQLNDELIALQEEYAEIQQQGFEDATKLQEDYIDTLADRAKAISDQQALFSEVQETEQVSSRDLTNNLKDQVKELERYNEILDELGEREISAELMEELQSQGLSEIESLSAIASMSDSQLKAYDEYYQEKLALSQSAAEKELAEERAQTAEAIKAITDETGIAFEVAPQLAEEFTKLLADGITDTADAPIDSAKSMADDIIAEVERALNALAMLDASVPTLSAQTSNLINNGVVPTSNSFRSATNISNTYNSGTGVGTINVTVKNNILDDAVVERITEIQNNESTRKGDTL